MSGFCINPSSNSVTEEYWVLEGNYRVNGQVTAAIILFFIAVGLPWNVMVLITVLKKRLYHQPAIMLLLNLVLTDILMLTTNLPLITVTGIAGEYLFGSTDKVRCQFCSAGFFSAVILIIDSIFVVALMALDRFLFIYKPLEYERKATPRRTLVAIGVIAMLSFAIGLFSYVIPEAINFKPSTLCCTPNNLNPVYIILVITVSCIALTVIIVCNIWVIYIVLKNINMVYKVRRSLCNKEKESYSQSQSGILRKKSHKKQLHLFRVFGGLLLSNTIALVPIILVEMTRLFSTPPIPIYSLAHILFLSQIAVHPILETTLISDVRKPLKKMVTCGLIKENNSAVTMEQAHFCC